MKRFGKIVTGGIQQKIFNLVLITIILLIGVYSVVIFYQASKLTELFQKANAQEKEAITTVSGDILIEELALNLYETTTQEAYFIDTVFKELAGTVGIMKDYAEELFENPENYSPVSGPDIAKDGTISVQLLTEADIDISDPQISADLGLIGNMSNLLMALFHNAQVDSCYIALPSGVMLLADDHSGSKFDENSAVIPIDIKNRPWYIGAIENGGVYYSDIAADVFTDNIGVMCSMPVYHNGELAAVVGADYYLNNMAAQIADYVSEDRFLCIINDRGHVVFSSQSSGVFEVKEAGEALDLRASDNEKLAAFINDAMSKIAEVALIEIDGIPYYFSGAPAASIGWTVINAVSKEFSERYANKLLSQYDAIVNTAASNFYANIKNAQRTIIILIAIVFVISIVGALSVAHRIVKPLDTITKRVRSLGGDNLQFKMEDVYKTGDEIEVLADSFALLSGQTLDYIDKVQTVTAENERISTELNMATAIQGSQLPRLFPAYPDRKEFDLYALMDPAKEVGGDFYDFFLIDNDHIALVIADVTGKGVPAALFMMVSRVLIKSHLQNGESPAQTLASVNNQLCESNEAQFFVTVWIGVLEISTGKGIAANAGHEHPVLRRNNDFYELVIYRHSPAVGTMENILFKEHEFVLNPGDSLFVYTDGVSEATNEKLEMYDTDRLVDALNQNPDALPQEAVYTVKADIEKFVDGAEQFDDITMLCLKYYGPDTE